MSTPPPVLQESNRSLLAKLLIVVVIMGAFGWALIPIYRKICEITGINLITRIDPAAAERARNTQVDTRRTVVVEFDANEHGPWRFKPRIAHLTVHPGELVQVDYDLVNLEPRATAGQAIPSYAPLQAGGYFQKLECFCFQQQVLGPNETRSFPVVFFLDPKLPLDVNQITLSYTFFELPRAALPADERS